MKDQLNYIIKSCLAEIYPFTMEDLEDLENHIDFDPVSNNLNTNWSYELIKRFENKWCWEKLQSNKALFEKVTLGLLFPEKVKLPECTCWRMWDFCDNRNCAINYDRLSEAKTLFDIWPTPYARINFLVECSFIDKELMRKCFKAEDVTELIDLDKPTLVFPLDS